jgi:hypothetical protein
MLFEPLSGSSCSRTGFPSAVICMLGRGLANFALFALVYPLVSPLLSQNIYEFTVSP